MASGHPRTRRHLLGQRLLNKTLLLSLKLLFFSQLIKGTVLRLKTSGTNQVMISDDARCPPKARFGRRTGGARCADHLGLTTLAGASRGDGLEARKSRKSSEMRPSSRACAAVFPDSKSDENTLAPPCCLRVVPCKLSWILQKAFATLWTKS